MSGSQAKWRVIKPCTRQDTGERMQPGDIVELGAFDYAALQVEQCIVPHVEDERETETVVPMETRRKWSRRK